MPFSSLFQLPFEGSNLLLRHDQVGLYSAEYLLLSALPRQAPPLAGNGELGADLAASQVDKLWLRVAPLVLGLLECNESKPLAHTEFIQIVFKLCRLQ